MIKVKRGRKAQATTFVVLGLVILAAVILMIYLRGQFIFGPVTVEKLEEQGIVPIKDHIDTCVNDVAPDYFERIGLQGGYLSTPTDTFRNYDGVPISYLCYNIEGKFTCYSRYLTKENMESQLEEAIKNGLSSCLNLQKFGKGAQVSIGALDVDVDIGDFVSLVTVNLPVSISKGDVVVEEDKFESEINVPLGELYGVSRDIIEVETLAGDFDQLAYMLLHKGQHIIDKKKPYPDKLYILKTKDSDYIFQFFVQDEPS
ncbi:MAG: hypothetical protein Q8Q42_01995 [Nanoarchaeota archaeon]|nr:hypothetical protein [Nanoarchaeota archaeon]